MRGHCHSPRGKVPPGACQCLTEGYREDKDLVGDGEEEQGEDWVLALAEELVKTLC